MADCWQLKSNNQGPTKLTMTTVRTKEHHWQEAQDPTNKCVCDEYKPFISQGYVCSPGSAVKTPITILRDTGASQLLLLEGTLPLTETFTGTEVLIQGVELEPIRVPLHEVELQSDIVTGVVRVGVPPSLPVEGLSLILGNDLAGGRVTADPCVTMQPTIPYGTKEEMSIYPACAVTRAMARKEAKNDSTVTSPPTTVITEESSL